MRYIGLDLSLTSTGYAFGETTGRIAVKSKGVERLEAIRYQVVARVLQAEAECAILEGYAYGRPNQAHQVGELGGVIRMVLHEMHIPFIVVAPTALKKWATGKGNATKDAMIAAAIRKHGFKGDSNDEADAWLLLKMAESGALTLTSE